MTLSWIAVSAKGMTLDAVLDLRFWPRRRSFCAERRYDLLARIPYLPDVVWALMEGRTMDQITEGGIALSMRQAWQAVASHFETRTNTSQQME
jgi:hypothetical protein